MTLLNKFFRKTAILAMAAFLFIGCEKPNDELGFNQVIDGVPGIKAVTFDSIVSYTHDLDSILVGLAPEGQEALGGYAGNRLLGAIADGHFGRVEASFLTELALSENNIDFGDNPQIDSVFIYLNYTGYYGDTFAPVSYEVYELAGKPFPNGVYLDDEGVVVDSAFYSDYQPSVGVKIGELLNHRVKPGTGAVINGEEVASGLRIDLDTAFFRTKVIEAPSSVFNSNQDFKDYFKGIYIKTTSIDGNIVYLSPTGDASAIYLYFHDKSEGDSAEAKSVSFNFSQSNEPQPVNFSMFNQDYSGAYPVSFDFGSMDTANGEGLVYAQSMGGVYSVFKIPGLDTLANKGYLVNQAILEVYKAQGTGRGLPPCERLEIQVFDKDTLGGTIKDFKLGNTLTGGGKFVSEPFRGGAYSFDITRYVFEIANGEKSETLAIVPYLKSSVANGVILSGGYGSQTPMKLKIYLTKP